MTDLDRGQVAPAAAEIYESFFVPALFAQWADRVLDAAAVEPGRRLLDVGCGSGVLARRALDRVGPAGTVAGVDPNEGMLAVARREAPTVDWRLGAAEDLPFADATFDSVVSQFALMFFDDRPAALREMSRVTRAGGRLAVAVWGSLEDSPGYAALTALVDRLFGTAAADAIRAPFSLGDAERLGELLAGAAAEPAVDRIVGTARFDSLDAWLHTEIRGWTLADLIDDDGFASLRDAAAAELGDLVVDGRVAFPVTALVASAAVPG